MKAHRERYSSTLSLTLAQDQVGWPTPALAALHPGKGVGSYSARGKWPQGRSIRMRKISPRPGLDPRTVRPDRLPEPNTSSASHERPEMLWKLPKHVDRDF